MPTTRHEGLEHENDLSQRKTVVKPGGETYLVNPARLPAGNSVVSLGGPSRQRC
jgi:hypothetical protein